MAEVVEPEFLHVHVDECFRLTPSLLNKLLDLRALVKVMQDLLFGHALVEDQAVVVV